MNRQFPVYTVRAECQDCYKCVRHCHCKAIKIVNGRAEVVPELCVSCGECVKVCPAHAIEAVPAAKKIRIFVSQCIQCGQCTEICPKQCLALSGEFLNASHDRYAPELVVED